MVLHLCSPSLQKTAAATRGRHVRSTSYSSLRDLKQQVRGGWLGLLVVGSLWYGAPCAPTMVVGLGPYVQ